MLLNFWEEGIIAIAGNNLSSNFKNYLKLITVTNISDIVVVSDARGLGISMYVEEKH